MEEVTMQFVVWIETVIADKSVAVHRVAAVARNGVNAPAELGLTLEDGKTILNGIEQDIVQTQVDLQSGLCRACIHCQEPQRVKDTRKRRLDTVFGRVTVRCRRFIRCTCQGGKARNLWPLAHWAELGMKRSTPERTYLLAEWGSKLPYRKAAELLEEFLPASNAKLSHTSVRRQTLSVGALLDQRVTEPEEYDCLQPCHQVVRARDRLTVAIDGTYVRSDLTNGLYQHYVVAGRVERDGELGGHFAWVAQRPNDALEFMRAAMRSDGWTERSRVAVLADGADGLADLVSAVSPNTCRSILDWFHISMRLRPIEQMVPKIAEALKQLDVGIGEFILEKMPRVRYQMWNGRWHAAVRRMHEIYQAAKTGLTVESATDTERLRRFRRHLSEFKEYLRNNWNNLTNYAHAYRHGLRVSSAPAESGMSHLVNQRMGKRQPMRWSAEGAHQLLQVRCAMLDRRLEAFFRELHPKFRLTPPVERECLV
jgi:hypothetical protein